VYHDSFHGSLTRSSFFFVSVSPLKHAEIALNFLYWLSRFKVVVYQPLRVVDGFCFWRTLSHKDDGRAVKNHSIRGLSSFTPLWSCQFLNSSMNLSAVFPVMDAVCILVITLPSLLAGVEDFLSVFELFPDSKYGIVCSVLLPP